MGCGRAPHPTCTSERCLVQSRVQIRILTSDGQPALLKLHADAGPSRSCGCRIPIACRSLRLTTPARKAWPLRRSRLRSSCALRRRRVHGGCEQQLTERAVALRRRFECCEPRGSDRQRPQLRAFEVGGLADVVRGEHPGAHWLSSGRAVLEVRDQSERGSSKPVAGAPIFVIYKKSLSGTFCYDE